MKKIILAAVIIFTTGILSTITKEGSTVKPVKAMKTVVNIDKSILGTAD
jgi:hypothetical protein